VHGEVATNQSPCLLLSQLQVFAAMPFTAPTPGQSSTDISTWVWRQQGDGRGLGLHRGMPKIALFQTERKYSVVWRCETIRDGLNWTPLLRCEVEFLSLPKEKRERRLW